MRSIYSQAIQVAVWLGSAADNSDLAMERLDNDFSGLGRKTYDIHLWEKEETKAILQLCQRQYWRRIWIVQEVVLGKNVVFYCGERSLQATKFAALFEVLGDSLQGIGVAALFDGSTFLRKSIYQSDTAYILQQRAYWHSNLEPIGLDVFDLFHAHRYKECMDVRDRVYGLLSLAKQTQIKVLDITADYTKSTSEIWKQIFEAYCRSYKPDKSGAEEHAKLLRNVFEISTTEDWITTFLRALPMHIYET